MLAVPISRLGGDKFELIMPYISFMGIFKNFKGVLQG